MNDFDCNALKRPEGWIAFYRQVHRSENFILRDGRHDIIFATEAEAKEAARVAFLDYLNSPISGMRNAAASNWDDANSAFNLPATLRPKVIKQRGKARPIEVVREGARA